MLIYLTSKRFPASTADHIYIRNLARAFATILPESFRLVIAGKKSPDLQNIPVHEAPVPHRLRAAFYFFWFLWFVLRLPNKSAPHTIFSNDFNLLAIAVFWCPFFSKRYNICSDWHLLSETWKDRYVLRGSQTLITTSSRLRDVLTNVEPSAQERIHVVYGGVDTDLFNKPVPSKREQGLPEDAVLVGYVGLFKTMGKDKGVQTLISALQYMEANVTVVLVGGSSAEIEEYGAVAESLHVRNRVLFIPRKTPEEVPAYQQSMDVLVIPYPNEKHFSDYGFPMKVYEYLAANKPIVYSNLPIIAEVLNNTGTSFTAGDPRSLAQALTKVQSAKDSFEIKNSEQYSWKNKAIAISELLFVTPSKIQGGIDS